MVQPNIVERLQQIDDICNELRTVADYDCENATLIEQHVSNIEGIVGEILTMVDGR